MTTPGMRGDERDDPELLGAHVAGDPDAFAILFRRHRDRLWGVALRTMGNPEDAADALQDGMISAFRRADSFRGEAQVTTWLHRVVVNACLDRLRAQKIRAASALPDDLDEYAGRGSLSTADQALAPEDAALADERRRMVLAALATLPHEQRAALILVDMEGYPVADVAEMLDCAVGTIKSRCSRGRVKLAGLLGMLVDEPRPDPPGNLPGSPSVPSTDPARGPPR
jgi:RNA polymerase sigma-70 factor, ECF subfamily